jgi:peptide/nickel transport system permease protein
MESRIDAGVETVETVKFKGIFAGFFARLIKEKPLGTICGVLTLLFLLTGIFAGVLAPYDLNETAVAPRLSAPSLDHPLGSDQLGRDVLSRIIYGARVSVIVSLAATTLATFISMLVGGLSGYFGGALDLTVQRFVDGWMSFPGIVLLIVGVTLVGAGMWEVIFLLGFLYGIGGSRIMRSAVMGIKENVYISAAHAVGCTTPRILIRHILPNTMGVLIILYTTRVPIMILTEASLSFLGLGVPPPAPTWGGMLSMEGRRFMLMNPWMAVWPGLSLALVVYGVSMFGDSIRDLLDPRLRGGGGRYTGIKKKSKKRRKKEAK